MRPEQLGDYRVPSDAYMHPDGERAAFVVTQMDVDADEYVRQLWIWDRAVARKMTSGRHDGSPRWAPDGATLAFLRKGPEEGDRPQVALIPTEGGEAEIVTDFELGVSELAWSPDGSRVAMVVAEYVDDVEDDDERKRLPKRVKHPSFRFDNIGWTQDKRSHIWALDVATKDIAQITSGDHSESGVAWARDGEAISYISSTGEDKWTNPLNQVHIVASSGGSGTPVTPRGMWDWAGFDDGGAHIMLGYEAEAFTLRPPQLHRADGDGSLRQLTNIDRNLMPGFPGGPLTAPRFVAGGGMTAVLEDAGTQRVVHISASGSVSDVAGGNRVISGWDPNAQGSAAVFTASTATNPGEVYWWDGTNERAITSLNDDFIAAASLVEPEPFMFESDGHQIHGWVYLPPGEGSVPLLYNVHGGPAAQYDSGFFDEFQVYVGAGYGVVAINPRGSTGYGFDHVDAPRGHWGDEMPPDIQDLVAAPYAAAGQFSRLDLDRLGVMGGSYGGLATVMVIALDQTYRSAVAERGVYNWVSMAGTSDIPYFMDLYLGTNMPEGADELWKASPLARAHNISTPTLVIHSEADYRCPIEQGQQLFSILYRGGVDTELLIFPGGEGHELSRSGKPKHRIDRFEAILDWHARHLG